VLLAAAVGAYFASMKLPRPSALENLFLIHNDGRLIHHVTKVENTLLDKDVVSAMFTAVQEFVKDSFQKGEVGLKKLEIGDKNVVIEKGQYAYVALIYSGWPTKEVFKTLALLLQDVEERYTGRLEKWNGTMKAVKGIEKMLQDYMDEAYKVGAWQEEQAIADEEWVDILDKEA
jgi:OOP family OmpA-OmpF porin